jgi:hypothetical protein
MGLWQPLATKIQPRLKHLESKKAEGPQGDPPLESFRFLPRMAGTNCRIRHIGCNRRGRAYSALNSSGLSRLKSASVNPLFTFRLRYV